MAYAERYVTNAGAGTADGLSLVNAWSWATMLTTLAAGQRANINGAITRGTSSDVFTNAGTAASPMSIRGYDSTIGDLESNTRTAGGTLDITNFPVVTYTTGIMNTPAHMVVEHLSFTTARNSFVLVTGDYNIVRKCKIENTIASGGNAGCVNTFNSWAFDCDLVTANNSTNAYAAYPFRSAWFGCRIDCTNNLSGAGYMFGSSMTACVFVNFGKGVQTDGPGTILSNCSFRNGTGSYVINLVGGAIINCAAWGTGGSSRMFENSGAVRAHNRQNTAYGNMGAANTNEGDWPVNGEVALSADPFTSSTDLTLNSTAGGGALCKGTGLHPYLDIGAWQSQPSVSGTSSYISLG